MKTKLEKLKDKIQTEYNEVDGQLKMVKENREKDQTKLQKHKEKIKICAKASKTMSVIQKSTKEKIKESIENLVTYALRYIHQEDYKFELGFSQRGSLTELSFNVKTKDFDEIHTLEDSCAGGILNIVAMALRVIFIELSKIEGPIIFDETFRNLSKGYLKNASKFLGYVNERTGRQIIMVTHKKDFLQDANNIISLT